MCRFDAPLFGIEVVGARTDVLHLTQRLPHEAYGDDATGHVGWQHDGLAAKIADGGGVVEIGCV